MPVHVLTAAPTLRPARHVAATATMAAAALLVSTHVTLRHEIAIMHNLLHVTDKDHDKNDNYVTSPPQERSSMTSVRLAALQWISVHVCTTATCTNQESPTLSTVEAGKMRTCLTEVSYTT